MKLKKWLFEFMKNHSQSLLIAIGIILCAGTLYFALPRILMEKPHLYDLTPSTVMANSSFNAQKSITIRGTGLEHLIGIYVNGSWEPDCTILSSTAEAVELVLPNSYYSEGNQYTIQIQTIVNSDLTALSNKICFEVLSDEMVMIPEITETYPSVLQFDNNLYQKIRLEGENLNEDSVVLVDDVAVNTTYVDGGLLAEVPYYIWCTQNSVILKVIQYYDGYPTSDRKSVV